MEVTDRELRAYKRLASAVILQWIEDFITVLQAEMEARKNGKKVIKMHDTDVHVTRDLLKLFNWPWTEYAAFWCDVAELDVKKLQKLALQLKELYSRNGTESTTQDDKRLSLAKRLLKELGRLRNYEKEVKEECLIKKRRIYF